MQQWRLDQSEAPQVAPPEVPHPDKSILILFPLCHSPYLGTLKANPGGTLQLFDKYVQRTKLICELAFRKAGGTPYAPSDKEKKAMLVFRGGDDIKDLLNMLVLSLTLVHSMMQLRKSAQVFKVAQTMWCKETCSLPIIRRELNNLNAGQKKSAMSPTS